MRFARAGFMIYYQRRMSCVKEECIVEYVLIINLYTLLWSVKSLKSQQCAVCLSLSLSNALVQLSINQFHYKTSSLVPSHHHSPIHFQPFNLHHSTIIPQFIPSFHISWFHHTLPSTIHFRIPPCGTLFHHTLYFTIHLIHKKLIKNLTKTP